MKLEKGMYVEYLKYGIRTIGNRINEIKECGYVRDNKQQFGLTYYSPGSYLLIEKEIQKASHNIIDLIEVGDYVNGLRVNEVREQSILILNDSTQRWNLIGGNDIKSIVTQQQFNSMKFEVR